MFILGSILVRSNGKIRFTSLAIGFELFFVLLNSELTLTKPI